MSAVAIQSGAYLLLKAPWLPLGSPGPPTHINPYVVPDDTRIHQGPEVAGKAKIAGDLFMYLFYSALCLDLLGPLSTGRWLHIQAQ